MSAHEPGSASCREMFAQLSEYIDDELDPDVCAGIDDHLGDCPPCRAFLESLERTVELTRELPEVELPEDLRNELLAAYAKAREAGTPETS